MVEQEYDEAGHKCRWLIRPNQSLPWRRAVQVYLAIAACCLAIGIIFALSGFWPVLPFAGLEIAVLGVAFYLCLMHSQRREIVTVGVEHIAVEKGYAEPRIHWECPRAWAQIRLERSPISWYPSRLIVAFRDDRVEVGSFLNENERCSLAAALQEVIRKGTSLH